MRAGIDLRGRFDEPAHGVQAILTVSKKTLADLREKLASRKATRVPATSAPAAKGLAAKAPAARDCPKCGHSNDADAKFCDSCGGGLDSQACSACVANGAQAKFCKGCGKPLAVT
jgi:membrane protease subunit (stomatin/prohibitin family)